MTDRPPGPRDWQPGDPDDVWWNPRPGDAYGPSDQEHRQPWEPPAPVHRFPGSSGLGPLPPAPEPSPSERAVAAEVTQPTHPRWSGGDIVGAFVVLAVVVLCVSGGLASYLESARWLRVVLGLAAVALVELVVVGAA